MQIITSSIPLSHIQDFSNCSNPEGKALCKAVVDIEKGIMAIGGFMHVDEEELLLDADSEQNHLWGINLYPDAFLTDSFIEFDSMINLRPHLGNRTRSVENPELRAKIQTIISSLIHV